MKMLSGEKMKIYFIVLHYINENETINCVKSIQELNCIEPPEILVVDNGSNNGTGQELLKRYNNIDNIHVIISDTNEGFARGNNIGISSVPKKNNALLVICNSDLIFCDKNFIKQAISEYEKTQYAVLGPDVVSEDLKKHENPTASEINSISDLKRQINRFKALNWLNKLNLVTLSRSVHKLTQKKAKIFSADEPVDSFEERIKVHGSCFVLSPRYFEKFEGLYDGTFLFQEENILADMCMRNNLKIVYSPDLQVIHLGSKSYKVKYANIRKRFKNYVYCCLVSLKNYMTFIKDSED